MKNTLVICLSSLSIFTVTLPLISVATTGIGSFEQRQGVAILVDSILRELQGSDKYNAVVRPAANAAATADKKFFSYLQDVRSYLKSSDYQDKSEAEKTVDRSKLRLEIEVESRSIARSI